MYIGVASPISPSSPITHYQEGFVRYALDLFNDRIEAVPSADHATCPLCGAACIPKCGSIIIWHWAHKQRADCDTWSEGETEWHRAWKQMVRKECQEVCKGPHRADIVGNGGMVIELQHSPISPETIEDREAFYGKMIWLFDASEYHKNLSFFGNKRADNYRTFKWSWARKSQQFIQSPLFWDVPQRIRKANQRLGVPELVIPRHILEVRRIHDSGNGWGYKWTIDQFVKRFMSSVLTEGQP